MSISISQYVDLLVKKLDGVAKTDTAANKSPSNESIASPALNRGDTLWTESNIIPATAATTAGIVEAYTGTSAVETTADGTTVAIGGVYPTWLTSLTDWIPPEFGSTYFVQAWVNNSGVSDPTVGGTQIFDSGTGGTGEWYFDYQAGLLNFIGQTIPAVLTSSKVIYIIGYRYVGKIGVQNLGNISIGNITALGSLESTGNITTTANISASYFLGNGAFLTGISGGGGASNVINATDTATNAEFYPVFVAAEGTDSLAQANANITINPSTGVFTSGGLITSGTSNTGNITGAFAVIADYFHGNGSNITNIPPSTVIEYGNSVVDIPTSNGNVLISVNATHNWVFDNTSTLTAPGNITTTGNVSTPAIKNGSTGMTMDAGYPGFITFFNSNGTNVTINDAGTILAGNIGNAATYLHGDGSNISGIPAPVAEASFSIEGSDFTATAGSRYGVDTLSNTVTATLPEVPLVGTAIFFADASGAFATNNLTIDPAGGLINGIPDLMIVNTNNQSFGLFFNGTTWRTY